MAEKFDSIVKACAAGFVLCVAMLSLSFTAAAQTKQVAGTVKDQGGNPLVGVSVTVAGTTVGAITNAAGAYSIAVPDGSTQLRFSYVGFEDKLENIASRAKVDVSLVEAINALDEVVVVNIGYGTTKRSDLTGSVSSINSKVIEAMPVATATEAIAGRMAGVQVTASEGGPDADIKIRVRGGGSITQDNSPLYIVDGFPVASMNDVAPSDIESIDVLKDASSTAVFGARGANGVIIITTKSGKSGKATVNFNGYAGVKMLTKTLDVLSPYEYVMWQYELANYKNSAVDTDSEFMKLYGAFDDLELYRNKQGTNWQDEVFGRNAITQNYNLSVSGGSDKTKYNISLAHTDDQSIMINSGYVRNNITAKLKTNISKKISIDFNTRWAQTKVNNAGSSTEGGATTPRLRHTLKYAPTQGIAAFVDDQSEFIEDMETKSDLINPVTLTNDEYRYKVRNETAYNGAFNWDIVKNLKFRSELGFTQRFDEEDRYWGPSTSVARSSDGVTAMIRKAESSTWRIANTLTWTPNLGRCGDFTGMIGQEVNSASAKYTTDEANKFSETMTSEQALAFMGLGVPKPTISKIAADENMLSYFARANYSLKDRYLFTATLRADGSSKFPSATRWGMFPSAAFGWKVSNEPWMQSTEKWLESLKLRLSYGAAGNDRIPAGVWKLTYEVSRPLKPYSIDNEEQSMLIPSGTLPNDKIKWETTITRNLGVDFGLWRGRLNGTVDVYYNTTKDLLIRASIPPNSGYEYQYQNIGSTSNRGLEVTLDGIIIQHKDFRLGMGANVAFNRGRVEELGASGTYPAVYSRWYNSTTPGSSDYLLELGKPVGQIYGYVTEGMYTFEDFDYVYDPVTKRATWNLKTHKSTGATGSPELPGALKLRDLDGNGEIT